MRVRSRGEPFRSESRRGKQRKIGKRGERKAQESGECEKDVCVEWNEDGGGDG